VDVEHIEMVENQLSQFIENRAQATKAAEERAALERVWERN
jgi:hypothetical protein